MDCQEGLGWVSIPMSLSFVYVRQRARHSLSLFAGIICLLLTSCGQADPAASASSVTTAAPVTPSSSAEVAEDQTIVVFLGDSLFAGYGLAPEDALPEQIEAIWRQAGIEAEAINAGVSGDTTANGLARFDWSVASAQPDLLVVALGANDFLMGVPPEVMRTNLSAILERAASEDIPVVLVGLSPRGTPAAGSREAAFAAVYPELATQYGVPYFPSLLGPVETDPTLLQTDGLHPTKEGVAKISAPLAQFLEPVITSLPRD